jgi:hypothetical protein
MGTLKRGLSLALTAPLLTMGLLAGHSLGYRWAVADPHARAHLLQESGHSYFDYVPLVLAIGLTLIAAALVSRGRAAALGDPESASPPWLFGLLAPIAFLVQELLERLIHAGQVHPSTLMEPAVLIGLALQLPLALIALLLASLLAQAADVVGETLADGSQPCLTQPSLPVLRASDVLAAQRVSTRGWSERGPPFDSF